MKYEISLPGSDAKMVATYEDGQLHALEGIHNLNRLWQEWAINAPVPLDEADIERRQEEYQGILEYKPVKLSKVDAKIAAFCKKYQEVYGKKYVRNTADITAIRPVPMTQELLELYFHNQEWWGKQPKSLRNYAKNYNALQQLQAKPAKKKRAVNFPDGYDPSFERKLRGSQLQQYWKHLRDLGLKPRKTATGKTIDWVKAGALLLIVLLLSGCMTERRVRKYLVKNPEIISEMSDTVYSRIIVPRIDTVITPAKSEAVDWWWTWGGSQGKDTIVVKPDSTKQVQLEVTATDTVVVTPGRPQEKRTNFRVEANVTPDTIYIRDTVRIDCPQVTTRTVIVQNSWKERAIWAGIGAFAMLILLLLLWRRK